MNSKGIVTGVKFIPVNDDRGLRAKVDIVLDGYLSIKGIGIVEYDGKYKVTYPTKRAGEGHFTVVMPLDVRIRERINGLIIRKYKRLINKEEE